MQMVPVTNSKHITHAGYDPENSVLGVRFAGGTHDYHYLGVPSEHHDKARAADSFGSYLHQHIKGKFDFKKVERTKTED